MQQEGEFFMLPIRGVYEVAIRVKDLAKAEPFYREVLDLEIGIRDEKRNWLFLRAGGDVGMIALQEDKGEWPLQHFAFTIDEADMETAGTYRVLVFLTVVGTVYVLAAGILIRKLLLRFRGSGPPLTNASIWYSRIVLGLAGLGILCGAYGYFVEPYWPSVTHIQVGSAKLVEGAGPVRVVLISD